MKVSSLQGECQHDPRSTQKDKVDSTLHTVVGSSRGPIRALVHTYTPPTILRERAEGTIHHTGEELPARDEQGVDGDKATSEAGWGDLSDVYGHRHGGDACGEREQCEEMGPETAGTELAVRLMPTETCCGET